MTGNEQIDQSLASLIEMATDGMRGAAAFAQAEIPDVVYQLLMWHGVKSGIWFVSGLTSLVMAPLIFVRMRRSIDAKISKARDDYDKGERWTRFSDSGSGVTSTKYDAIVSTYPIAPWAVLVPMLLFGISNSISNLTWLQILIAPKLYLLEYAASLVK